MTESRMTVEEAQALLQGYLDRIKQPDWTFHIYDTAIRVVLDELKALQECSTCSYKPGEWCQK